MHSNLCGEAPLSPPWLVQVTFHKMACLNVAITRERRFCFPSSQGRALWLKRRQEAAQGLEVNRWQSCDLDQSLCASPAV